MRGIASIASRGRGGGLGILFCVLCAFVCVWVFSVAPAQAAFSRHTFTGSFGPEGPQSLTSFQNVQGVAVDSEGNVYVYDTEELAGWIYKFNAKGEPEPFSKLLEDGSEHPNVITGVGGGGSGEDELAVDDSSGTTRGDIYLANRSEVRIYESDGERVEAGGKPVDLTGEVETEVPGAPWGEPCGVAVDSAGNVYVGLAGHNVSRYTPTGKYAVNSDYTASLWGLGEICNVAVDPAGNVYAKTYQGPITKYEPSQFETRAQFVAGRETPASGSEVDLTGATLAVDPDPSRDLLYVDEANHEGQSDVAEYESSGELKRIGMFGVSEPGLLVGEPYGIAVAASGEVYTSNGAGLVNIYEATPPEAPLIEEEAANDVTETTGTLDAEIDPALYDTHYYFQWGTADCTQDPSACTEVPVAPGTDIGSGESPVGVSAELHGLTPGSVYHYRVVATNANGTSAGADTTFTTRPAAITGPTLLDGRAYELVSPPEKVGATLLRIGGYPGPTGGGVIQAEPEGNALTYVSNDAFAEPVSSALPEQYVATRGAGGWSNVNVTPPMKSAVGSLNKGGPYRALSSDLSRGLLLRPAGQPSLDPRAPDGFENLVLDEGLRGAGPSGFQAALVGSSAEQLKVEFEGANPGLTHIILRERGNAKELFEWTPGGPDTELQPIGAEAILGGKNGQGRSATNAISDDGSRIYYTSGGNLFLREDGTSGIEVDASDGGAGEFGGGVFDTASSDGSRAFFTDTYNLTANARAESGPDLYMFEAASRKLTDIAPQGDVQGVLGASEDGSYVYFVANGVLASGARQGHCQHGLGLVESRTCNLYVWHEGTTRFITTLSEGDENGDAHSYESPQGVFQAADWTPVLEYRTSRVSPDGEDVVFMADGDLTGYDSRPMEASACVNESGDQTYERPCQEVYVYDAVSGALRCVSCNPTGGRPQGPSAIPGGTPYAQGETLYQSRVLSDEEGRARVFFDSEDALAPQDTNGVGDVYEWEEDGRGDCAQAGGCLGLVSNGTNSVESEFLDASVNGDDVFFLTYAKLASQDTDNLVDVYDARAPHVSGEMVGSPPPAAALPPCDNGDSCKPPASAQPSLFGAPSSATFTGAGNPSSVVIPATRPKSKVLSRAQKLKVALRVCAKKGGKHRRRVCEEQARKRYGPGGSSSRGRRAAAMGRR